MIGVLDSGVGALETIHLLRKKFPTANIYHFSDPAYFPFSKCNQAQLIECVKNAFEWFAKNDVSVVVIACNTASFVWEEAFNAKDYEQFQVISLRQYAYSYDDDLLVICTPFSKPHFQKKYSNVLEMPNLAQYVEQNMHDKAFFYIKERIVSPKKLLYGCTHYPLIHHLFLQAFGQIEYFNPVQKMCTDLKGDFHGNGILKFADCAIEEFYFNNFLKFFR